MSVTAVCWPTENAVGVGDVGISTASPSMSRYLTLPFSGTRITDHPSGMVAGANLTLSASVEGTETSGMSCAPERSTPLMSSSNTPESESVIVRYPAPVGLNTAPCASVNAAAVPEPVTVPVAVNTQSAVVRARMPSRTRSFTVKCVGLSPRFSSVNVAPDRIRSVPSSSVLVGK